MGFIKKIIGILLLTFVTYVGYFVYKNYDLLIPKIAKFENSYADQIKARILKYDKPARVEVINYIKNPNHLFQKDINDIKKIKVPLNKDSKSYIKIQFFVDDRHHLIKIRQRLIFYSASRCSSNQHSYW